MPSLFRTAIPGFWSTKKSIPLPRIKRCSSWAGLRNCANIFDCCRLQALGNRRALETEFVPEPSEVNPARVSGGIGFTEFDHDVRIQCLDLMFQVCHCHRLTRGVVHAMAYPGRAQQARQRPGNIVHMRQQNALQAHVRQFDSHRLIRVEQFENVAPPRRGLRPGSRTHNPANAQAHKRQVGASTPQLFHIEFCRAIQIFRRRPIGLGNDPSRRASSVDAQRASKHESPYPELAPQLEQVETARDIRPRPAPRVSLSRCRQDRRQVNDSPDALRLKHAAQLALFAYVAGYANARILRGRDLRCDLVQPHKPPSRGFEQPGDSSANESVRAGDQDCALGLDRRPPQGTIAVTMFTFLPPHQTNQQERLARDLSCMLPSFCSAIWLPLRWWRFRLTIYGGCCTPLRRFPNSDPHLQGSADFRKPRG